MRTLHKHIFKINYQLLLTAVFICLTNIQVFAQELVQYNPDGDNTVAVMQVLEVDFVSEAEYDDEFTAYMNVDVWVDLVGPEGSAYRIPVFWGGDNTFHARLVATTKSIVNQDWTWKIDASTVTNNDQGFLDGQIGKSGSFTAVEADVSTNSNNHGFIKVADNNRTLEYADGTPYFYTADTSWSLLTNVFGFESANEISGISFKKYILDRKEQGYNGVNVISSFPNDSYTDLWAEETHHKKTGPNGETPFMVDGVVDYTKINPNYWNYVDDRMQFMAEQGFVTLFETVRRTEDWPFRSDTEQKAFYNYVRYLWARYGCYNMIFSWVHHDVHGGVYENWVPLVQHAHNKLKTQIGNQMPYGQPRTAMSYNSSLNNWERDIPDALDIQNVSNAERDEDMHKWLSNIFFYQADNANQPVTIKPAFNLEPFYPGWGSHSQNEVNDGLSPETMAQMQMYGSVLSGGLAGHAWGDGWHAGVGYAGLSTVNRTGQVNAIDAYNSQAMGHLKNFILDADHEYHRLIPAADTHLSDSQNFIHTLSVAVKDNDLSNEGVDEVEFALGFFTANSSTIPYLKGLTPTKNYLFEWWNVSEGEWIPANDGNFLPTNSDGVLTPPDFPENEDTKSWAYRIRSEDYITPNTSPVANAGEDLILTLPTNSIQIQGSGNDTDGGNITYTWSLISGPNEAVLTDSLTSILKLSNLIEGEYIVQLLVTDNDGEIGTDLASVTVEAEPIVNNFALRINSGGQETSHNGDSYIADTYFNTGRTLDRPQTGLLEPWKTFRYSRSQVMSYNIPLEDGTYTVNLHFAELWFGATSGGAGGVGNRIFDVKMEGELKEDNLDVYKEAGANSEIIKTHSVTVTDGILNIDFSSLPEVGGVRHPIINAIEILGTTSSNRSPVAIAASNVMNGTGPLNVQFTGSSSSDDKGIVSYSWDFGDNLGSSTASDPNYTFTEPGSYEVELTVTDKEGLTDVTSLTIIVVEEEAPFTGGLYWPLNESSGVTAYEFNREIEAKLINGFSFDTNGTNGIADNALNFDGLNDHIHLGDIDNDLESNLTVSAWIKPSNATGGYQGVVGSDTRDGFMMFVKRGQLYVKFRTSENMYILKGAGNIQNNVWQMITFTYDGSDIRWYINGVLEYTEHLPGTINNSNEGYIGYSGWGNEYFEGTIDDVRLYNTTLSTSEIATLYQQNANSSQGSNSNLITNKGLQITGFPNPTNDKVRILGTSIGEKEIIVTNLEGRVLIAMKTDDVAPELDFSSFSGGMYIVSVFQNETVRTFKAIKN